MSKNLTAEEAFGTWPRDATPPSGAAMPAMLAAVWRVLWPSDVGLDPEPAPHPAQDDPAAEEARWAFICRLYPEVGREHAACEHYSAPVAQAFRDDVMREQAFDDPQRLAELHKRRWLDTFIGRNLRLRAVVRLCIDGGLHGLAHAIRHATGLLGDERAARDIVRIVALELGCRSLAQQPTPRAAMANLPPVLCRRVFAEHLVAVREGGSVEVLGRAGPDCGKHELNLVFPSMAHALNWLLRAEEASRAA